MMDFGEALQQLKVGNKVARAGWNGKGMWLFLVPANQWGLGYDVPFDYAEKGNKLLPWIGMKTADNGFVPWLASQTDILATDWDVI